MPEQIAEHFLTMVSLLALISAWLGASLGKVPKGRKVTALVLFPVSLLIPVAVGGVIVLVGMLLQYGLHGLSTSFQNPFGTLAYLAETGLELSVFAIVLTPISYLWFVKKGWRHTKTEMSEVDGPVAAPPAMPDEQVKSKRTETAFEQAVVTVPPFWWKWALGVWAILSICWVGLLGYEVWEHRNNIAEAPEPVTEVTIYPELSKYLSGLELVRAITRRVGVETKIVKPEPGSDAFRSARNMFSKHDQLKNLNDEQFADYLWGKILAAKRLEEENRKRQADMTYAAISKSNDQNFLMFGLLGPLALFILMRAVRWHLGRFPPSQYSVHVRRGLAFATIWLMGSIAWAFIEEGELKYAFTDDYLPLFFAPPIVIFSGFILWSWANKTPMRNG